VALVGGRTACGFRFPRVFTAPEKKNLAEIDVPGVDKSTSNVKNECLSRGEVAAVQGSRLATPVIQRAPTQHRDNCLRGFSRARARM